MTFSESVVCMDNNSRVSHVDFGRLDRESRRNWPFAPTRLEHIAAEAGLEPDELRDYLRRQIDQEVRASAPKSKMIEVECPECGVPYEVSERRAKAQAAEGLPCRECRYPTLNPIPTKKEQRWAEAQPPEVLASVSAML